MIKIDEDKKEILMEVLQDIIQDMQGIALDKVAAKKMPLPEDGDIKGMAVEIESKPIAIEVEEEPLDDEVSLEEEALEEEAAALSDEELAEEIARKKLKMKGI